MKLIFIKMIYLKTWNFRIPQNKSAAIKNKNSLAKLLYDFLFQFIMSAINKSLRGLSLKQSAYIAVLDIAGFGMYNFELICRSFIFIFCYV